MKFIKLFFTFIDIYLTFRIWILKMFKKLLTKFIKGKPDHSQDRDSDSDTFSLKDL